jgi:hypothetical protein
VSRVSVDTNLNLFFLGSKKFCVVILCACALCQFRDTDCSIADVQMQMDCRLLSMTVGSNGTAQKT